jgi:hypothetical protein
LFLSFVILFSSIFRCTYTCHVVSRPIFFHLHFSLDLLCSYECSIASVSFLLTATLFLPPAESIMIIVYLFSRHPSSYIYIY